MNHRARSLTSYAKEHPIQSNSIDRFITETSDNTGSNHNLNPRNNNHVRISSAIGQHHNYPAIHSYNSASNFNNNTINTHNQQQQRPIGIMKNTNNQSYQQNQPCQPQQKASLQVTTAAATIAKKSEIETNLINDLLKSLDKYPYKPKYTGNPIPDATISGRKPATALAAEAVIASAATTSNSAPCPAETLARSYHNRLTSLTSQNAAYFEHLAGTCVCARCTCGKHKCSQRLSLVEQGRPVTKSVYIGDYQEMDMAKSKPVRAECPPDNLINLTDPKFENHTTNRDHYTPKKGDNVRSLTPNQNNIQIPFMPSECRTSYKDVHVIKSTLPAVQFIPTNQLAVIKNMPFAGKSEMKAQYRPNREDGRQQPIKNSNEGIKFGFDQSKLPDFYKSTYQMKHSPQRPNPSERGLIDGLRKMQANAHRSVDKLAFVPTTTHRDHFQGNRGKICPITIEQAMQAKSMAAFTQDSYINPSGTRVSTTNF